MVTKINKKLGQQGIQVIWLLLSITWLQVIYAYKQYEVATVSIYSKAYYI